MLVRRAVGLAFATALGLSSCGVRAPTPIDVAALVRSKGAVEARRSLEVRALADPRDVQARLALAALADEQGRPSQAIEHLEVVYALGGPIGTRWHDDDRARLARLLLARGRARLARGAASAERDLLRAKELGAVVDALTLRAGLRAVALARLQHVDARERASGKRLLAQTGQGAATRGARPDASAADRGALGALLWELGARRAAWEELSAWHAGTKAPRDPSVVAAYLQARSWWTPLDAAPPSAAELVGPERCRFVIARCRAVDVVASDDAALAALVAGPSTPTRDPDEASAWIAIALRESLRGNGSWGALVAARVDLDAIDASATKPFARGALALWRGEPAIAEPELRTLAPHERLVVAATRALRGGTPADVRAALGDTASSGAAALLRIVEPPAATPLGTFVPHAGAQQAFVAAAATTYAHARASRFASGEARDAAAVPPIAVLATVVSAYLHAPARADQRAIDVVATSVDGALAHATLGALFDALGDPARSRAAWQAAVDGSAEPAFVRGLAIAAARANDPDAALVHATTASAAWGDPAAVWLDVARALHETGKHVHALEAARFAIELAGPEVYAPALELAIDANRALGRTMQIESLSRRRAAAFHPIATARASDPTDPARALAEPANVDRLWTASRWNRRDVATRVALLAALPATDTRGATIRYELGELATDRDDAIARRAVTALRR